VPLKNIQMARPIVRVGQDEYELVAAEAMARELNATAPGTPLRIEAELVCHSWKTEEGRRHQSLELRMTQLEVGAKPR